MLTFPQMLAKWRLQFTSNVRRHFNFLITITISPRATYFLKWRHSRIRKANAWTISPMICEISIGDLIFLLAFADLGQQHLSIGSNLSGTMTLMPNGSPYVDFVTKSVNKHMPFITLWLEKEEQSHFLWQTRSNFLWKITKADLLHQTYWFGTSLVAQ